MRPERRACVGKVERIKCLGPRRTGGDTQVAERGLQFKCWRQWYATRRNGTDTRSEYANLRWKSLKKEVIFRPKEHGRRHTGRRAKPAGQVLVAIICTTRNDADTKGEFAN